MSTDVYKRVLKHILCKTSKTTNGDDYDKCLSVFFNNTAYVFKL